MSWFHRFLRSAPGSHQGCSVLHRPWLEGHFIHMTSNTAGTAFYTCRSLAELGIPLALNDGDTDNSAWGLGGMEILPE